VLPVDKRSDEEIAAAARNQSINRAIAIGVLALILAGLAIWFRGQADSLTGGTDGDNVALTDSAATSEVKGKLTVAIEKTLSYNFTDLDATAKAVKDNLAGTAVCEYDKLFGVLKEQAPAQKLILTTKVRELGVTRLAGDSADLLVFVDQSTTRTEQNQTTASGAQFGIRAQKIDGVWKITDFDMLDQPLPDGKSAPSC
jgi:Mce-associated membrane protein